MYSTVGITTNVFQVQEDTGYERLVTSFSFGGQRVL